MSVQKNIDKFLGYQKVFDGIDVDLPAEMTVEYFASLRNMVEPKLKKELTRDESNKRAEDRTRAIKLLLPTKFKVETIVDIGCSNGKITSALVNAFKLDKKNVFGLDVRRDPNLDTSNFTFIKLKPGQKYPFKDESISLVTSMVVLHHVKDLEFVLKEVHRILKPGGYFIIREHDCDSEILKETLDIIHGLYACVLNEPQEETPEEFIKNHFADYKTKDEWAEIIAPYGFMRQYEIGVRNSDLQKLYYMAFKKSQTIRSDRIINNFNSIIPPRQLSNVDYKFLIKHGKFRKMLIKSD